jgi:hypothetical protein
VVVIHTNDRNIQIKSLSRGDDYIENRGWWGIIPGHPRDVAEYLVTPGIRSRLEFVYNGSSGFAEVSVAHTSFLEEHLDYTSSITPLLQASRYNTDFQIVRSLDVGQRPGMCFASFRWSFNGQRTRVLITSQALQRMVLCHLGMSTSSLL